MELKNKSTTRHRVSRRPRLMTSVPRAVPAGFSAFTVGGVEVVCADRVAPSIRAALGRARRRSTTTRARHAGARAARRPRHRVRGAASAATSTSSFGTTVTADCSRPLTRDLFLPPTRAPHELETSERLQRGRRADAGGCSATRSIRAPLGFRRADVVTREVADSFDLSAALMSGGRGAARERALGRRAIS